MPSSLTVASLATPWDFTKSCCAFGSFIVDDHLRGQSRITLFSGDVDELFPAPQLQHLHGYVSATIRFPAAISCIFRGITPKSARAVFDDHNICRTGITGEWISGN